MRALLLLLVWITPALVAGMLGWKGIWGGGSALGDYLIPIPVAGGVFHVPSFIVAAALIWNLKKMSEPRAQFVFLGSLGVFLVAQTLQLDFARLNAWLFTDYAPSGSPFRFRANPLYLFIASDALWVAICAWAVPRATSWKHALMLPLIPVVMIGFAAVAHKFGGPEFTYGFSSDTRTRGNVVTMVHTTRDYDEKTFRNWLEGRSGRVMMPWDSVNAENLAVLFTRSMQAIKWRKQDGVKDVVATFCFYEEDRSSTAHAGYFDCFAGRSTLSEKLSASHKSTKTGFGRDVDGWVSRAGLCRGVEISERGQSGIALVDLCRAVKRQYPELLQRLAQEFGEDSAQVRFLKSQASSFGIGSDRRT